MNGKKAREQRHNRDEHPSEAFMRQRGYKPVGDGYPVASPEVEAASEMDKAWFASHPERDRYIRRKFDGEFPLRQTLSLAPDERDATQRSQWTLVLKIPHGRIRQPMTPEWSPTLDPPVVVFVRSPLVTADDSGYIAVGVDDVDPDVLAALRSEPQPQRTPGPPDDMAYFAQHPDRVWRVRRRQPGEFGEADGWTDAGGEFVPASSHLIVCYNRVDDSYRARPLDMPPDATDEQVYTAAVVALVPLFVDAAN